MKSDMKSVLKSTHDSSTKERVGEEDKIKVKCDFVAHNLFAPTSTSSVTTSSTSSDDNENITRLNDESVNCSDINSDNTTEGSTTEEECMGGEGEPQEDESTLHTSMLLSTYYITRTFFKIAYCP